jgi:hypothetical protein
MKKNIFCLIDFSVRLHLAAPHPLRFSDSPSLKLNFNLRPERREQQPKSLLMTQPSFTLIFYCRGQVSFAGTKWREESHNNIFIPPDDPLSLQNKKETRSCRWCCGKQAGGVRVGIPYWRPLNHPSLSLHLRTAHKSLLLFSHIKQIHDDGEQGSRYKYISRVGKRFRT